MNWTERKITPVQTLNWCCCATALAKAAQLRLQWISCIFAPCLCCPVFAWCSNTLPTLVLTAGGSWASSPPPLPHSGRFADRIWTLLLFWTVISEPFFPSTGGKMVLNVVPCCNGNGKGNSHVYFIPLSQRAAPTSPLVLPPSGCVVSPWEQLPHTLMCTQCLYLYIIYTFK